MAKKADAEAAAFAYEGLDRVIHERARLGILTSMLTHAGTLSFADLKRLCSLTDGNLARHLQVLEQDGMVRVTKGERGGRPHTAVAVTAPGRRRYLKYLATLEQIVKDASEATAEHAEGPRARTLVSVRARAAEV